MPERLPGETPGVMYQRAFVLCSPVLLIGLCHLVQRLGGRVLGEHAVIATMLLFWGCIAGLIAWSVGVAGVRRWLAASQGAKTWRVLALLLGLMSLPNFLAHWQVLQLPTVALAWLMFALINPWLEETYWRGLLMDATRGWGAWLSIGYSSFWFAASHPLIWGVHTPAMWKPSVVIALFVVGALWGLTYWKTRSLRWTAAGHMCANLLGLAAPVLLNLVSVG